MRTQRSRNTDTLLRVEVVAAMIGTTSRTLRRWRVAGYGPPWERLSFPRSGQIRYPKKQLQAWLRAERKAA